jgi:hypothetical protein
MTMLICIAYQTCRYLAEDGSLLTSDVDGVRMRAWTFVQEVIDSGYVPGTSSGIGSQVISTDRMRAPFIIVSRILRPIWHEHITHTLVESDG